MGKRIKIKVISGGQVGADRIGLEEAKKLGFETGGTAPHKYLTSKGSDLSLKDFGLTEISNAETISYQGRERVYGPRTEQNVLKSDLTLLYSVEGRHSSRGSILTRNLAKRHGKPLLQNPTPKQIADLVSGLGKKDLTINIAGNREYIDRKTISEGLQAASNPSWSQDTAKNLNNAIKSKISNQTSKIPKDARTIYFQGPSKGITDPKAFKQALTERYREEMKTWGGKKPIHVLYGGRDWNQADQLIAEWAKEGYKQYRHAKQQDTDFKTMASQITTPKLFSTAKGTLTIEGYPKIDKLPISFSKLDSPDESIEKISFSRQAKIVYPGKDTKPHFERFDQLLAQKDNKLKPAVEAYLDELEDFGKLNTPEGNKQMLAGIQVIEDKGNYYDFTDKVLDRIKNIQKGVSNPMLSGEKLETADADSPELVYKDTDQEALEYDPRKVKGPEDWSIKSSPTGKIRAKKSKTDELKAETSIKVDDEDVTLLSDLDPDEVAIEDEAISKETKQYEKLKSIQARVGSERWGKWMDSPESRRALMNYIGDVFKKGTDTVLGIRSSNEETQKKQARNVITGPNKKGILLRADPKLLKSSDKDIANREAGRLKLEKKYIFKERNVSGEQRLPRRMKEELLSDRKDIKIARVNAKIADLRLSGERAIESIKKFRTGGAGHTHAGKYQSPIAKQAFGGTRYGLMPWMVYSEKMPSKTFPKSTSTVLAPEPKTKVVTKDVTPIKKQPKWWKLKHNIGAKAHMKTLKRLQIEAKHGKGMESWEGRKLEAMDRKVITKSLQKKFHTSEKPPNVEYKHRSTAKKHGSVGKGIKFTRGLGAFTLFSTVTGVLRARKELKSAGIKDPSFLETLDQMIIPKSNFQINQYIERKKLTRAI